MVTEILAIGNINQKYFENVFVFISDMRNGKLDELNQRNPVMERWANVQLSEYGMLANNKTLKQNIVSTIYVETDVFGNQDQTLYSVKIKAFNKTGQSNLYPILLYYEDINYGLLNGGDIEEEIKNIIKQFIKSWTVQNSK